MHNASKHIIKSGDRPDSSKANLKSGECSDVSKSIHESGEYPDTPKTVLRSGERTVPPKTVLRSGEQPAPPKRILVTGANGYIGQGLVRQLLDDGCSVIAADVSCHYVDPRAEICECDLFSLEEPYDFFGRPDAVFHLAWRNGFVHNDSSHIEDLPKHYAFVRRLLEAGLPQFTGMGSMHEIGFYEGAIRESTPTNPQSLYGIAKDALRRAAALAAAGSRAVFQWVRGFYIVGNSEFGSSIFSKLTAAEHRGETAFPFTLGRNQWDFIDYDQFCRQLAAIVEQTEETGIINACSGYPEKLSDRVERFIRDNGYHVRLEYGAFPDRPYDSKAVWGDDTRIRRILERRVTG